MGRAQFLVDAVSAFLILPVLLGVQPGTFGSARSGIYCAADAGLMQTPPKR
jgi:hypothetical protein